MFHVTLALPVLAAFGAVGWLILLAMGALIGFAFFGVLVVNLLFRALRWVLWIPAAIGLAGTAVCFFAGWPLALSVILAFWAFYALAALAGWIIAAVLRAIFGWIGK